jgi:hypothetical protein
MRQDARLLTLKCQDRNGQVAAGRQLSDCQDHRAIGGAISPGSRGPVAVKSGQSNRQVRPSGCMVLSDSQADSLDTSQATNL